jgi:tol-pal system protein YbgF
MKAVRRIFQAAALAALAASLFAAPLARGGMFDDEEARKKIADLAKEVQAQNEVATTRLLRLEGDNEQRGRAIIELSNQIEALKGEIAKLRGQIELLVNDAGLAQKRQKDFYVDLDGRLRNLEKSAAAGAAAATASAGAPPAAAEAADANKAAAPDSGETRVYEASLNQFKLGNYQGAIAGFQTFIQTWPSSANAPSAQYWIGNAYFALRDYKSAIAAQQKLVAAWPDHAKAPDALLNMASSQVEAGDARSARKTLEGLLARYPKATAADTAKQRLARMK